VISALAAPAVATAALAARIGRGGSAAPSCGGRRLSGCSSACLRLARRAARARVALRAAARSRLAQAHHERVRVEVTDLAAHRPVPARAAGLVHAHAGVCDLVLARASAQSEEKEPVENVEGTTTCHCAVMYRERRSSVHTRHIFAERPQLGIGVAADSCSAFSRAAATLATRVRWRRCRCTIRRVGLPCCHTRRARVRSRLSSQRGCRECRRCAGNSPLSRPNGGA
jgi:hypothetical protein